MRGYGVSLGIYERFEINPLSTWLNEHGKVGGKKSEDQEILWPEMKKGTWLTGQNALTKSG